MRTASVVFVGLAVAALVATPDLITPPVAAQASLAGVEREPLVIAIGDISASLVGAGPAFSVARARLDEDFAAMRTFRPGFAFWRHIFTIPDGSFAFGSAEDGRLLATFPARGDWSRVARWEEPWLASVLAGARLEAAVVQRRDQVASLLATSAGPVIHNATRGNFLLPNARRYGGFLSEWGAIYERFGVPGEIGLAQAILESGLNGRIRSEARALGFCQWLPQNWERLKRLAHHTIEGYNQTSQAPYCAAYLAILTTKYGSFIPALSEHHAGGTNVARVVITGGRLGGQDARERYFLGSQLARDLREISPRTYSDVYATYGPRSYLYAEMVFGNALNVKELEATTPQRQVFAMRTRRSIPLAEITRRTGLSVDEVRRFNPALVQQVPARANLYLPTYIPDFGSDVSFWHLPPTPAYLAVLNDFVRIDASLQEWHDPSFRARLREFQRRFTETNTEEGHIMATVLAYVAEEMYTGRRNEILAEYANSSRVLSLIQRGVSEREALRPESLAARSMRAFELLGSVVDEYDHGLIE